MCFKSHILIGHVYVVDPRIAPPLTLEKISSGDVEKRAGALEAGLLGDGERWNSWYHFQILSWKVEIFLGDKPKHHASRKG